MQSSVTKIKQTQQFRKAKGKNYIVLIGIYSLIY